MEAILIEIAKMIYAYCTDFVIILANILELSYYEINAILFCGLYPFLLIVLFTIYLIQIIRFRRVNGITKKLL